MVKMMNHSGTVRLETDRLILRKFTEKDIEPAFRNWTSDEKVTEFLTWPVHSSVEVTGGIIKEWIAGYESKDFYQWAIVPKDNNDEPIGTISVVSKKDDLDIVHIGYCIGSKWWCRGITSEAFSGIIPFLFETVGVNRIESRHDPKNPNSGKVMMKCGLQYEGTLRQSDRNNYGVVDASWYGLLRSEYNK